MVCDIAWLDAIVSSIPNVGIHLIHNWLYSRFCASCSGQAVPESEHAHPHARCETQSDTWLSNRSNRSNHSNHSVCGKSKRCKMSVLSVCNDFIQNDTKTVGSGHEMKDKAYDICRKFLSGEWNKISSNDMVFKTVRYVVRHCCQTSALRHMILDVRTNSVTIAIAEE